MIEFINEKEQDIEYPAFIRMIDWLPGMSTGWGNGYVCLPPGHKYHGVGYDDIPVHVHGGLTYSSLAKHMKITIPEEYQDYWVVGFDTAHYSDDLVTWPKNRVWGETVRLARELKK